MAYETDKEIIKHFCNNLFPRLIKKFIINKEDLIILKKAKSILVRLIK